MFSTVAEASLSGDGKIGGEVKFEQADERSPVKVSADISGMEPYTTYALEVHQGANCSDNGPVNRESEVRSRSPDKMCPRSGLISDHFQNFRLVVTSDGNGRGSVAAAGQDLTLFGDGADKNVVGRSLELISETSGETAACGAIREPSGWNLILIIIVGLVVLIFLLLVLIICLCVCCCCKK